MSEKYTRVAVGGSDIQVMLEFPTIFVNGQAAILHMASCISISYSVYRAKSMVYNIGQPVLGGLSIGKKYVAGSIITVSYDIDEISNFVETNLAQANNGQAFKKNSNGTIDDSASSAGTFGIFGDDGDQSLKDVHTVMRDDLTPFNIHLLSSEENYGDARANRIVVYGAQFINNGQVMSINDLITENTLQFIGRDIREQHAINSPSQSIISAIPTVTASSLLS